MKLKLTIKAVLAAVGLLLGAGAATAQSSTNWVINFDVPGGATSSGWTNYYGPGAYGTNAAVSYYWNAIADNQTNSGSLLGDGVTASSIVFANQDKNGAPGYSPVGFPVNTAALTNFGNFWALFLPYQHDGANAAGGTSATQTNVLYNVPPGTYNLYVYGMNADPRIATAYGNSQDDRGSLFQTWSDLTSTKTLTDVNTTNVNFVKGDNYVEFRNVVTSNGVIYCTYVANSTVFAKYNGASKLAANGEGDFDGLQLAFVSTNTTPVPSSVSFTNLYPNGNYQFQSSPTLSLTAVSTNGIDTNQISISLSITMLGGPLVGQSFTTNLNYFSGGISISGGDDLTNLLISTPLMTNALYSAIITVGDLSGDSQTLSYSFDTIDTTYDYSFEAEDFNYNNGLFINTPQTNGYAGLAAHNGVDISNTIGGPALYRSSANGLATELCGDLATAAYLRTNSSGVAYDTNYDVPAADNVVGNWGNYTRTFPAGAYQGAYLVYMRASSVGGQTNAASLSVMSGTATTSTQNPTLLGTFSPPDTGGQQSYAWVPLLDSNGNRAIFVGGSVETLRVTSLNSSVNGVNANYSANSYLLIPVNTNTVVITNLYPNGATVFQATNELAFTVDSTAVVLPANISVVLTATNLLGQGYATNLTGTSGLTVTGSSTSHVVTYPLTSNMIYTATLQAADNTGIITITNITFDTVIPAHIFEAEDYNYYDPNSGIDGNVYGFDPFTGANGYGYGSFDGVQSTLNIDYYDAINAADTNEMSILYRGDGTAGQALPAGDDGRGTLDIEACSDVSHANVYDPSLASIPLTDDYDIGNARVGNWADYTRVYPAGTYNIYMRAAADATITNALSMTLVGGDITTSNQITTNVLGTFAMPNTGGFQTYTWVPLTGVGGQLAKVSFDGTSASTLRATWDSTGFNVNYFMLIPADTSTPVISAIYPNGQDQFQSSGSLTFNAASSAGLNTSTISVQLVGTNLLGQVTLTTITTANGLIVSGPSTNLSISVPLAGNTVYSAVITVTSSNNRTTSATVSFDTINPSFIFEAEDFNYGGGQFINNPVAVDAYSNLVAVVGIDTYDPNFNTNGQVAYRTNGLNTEVTGDTPRTNYTAAGLPDYDVGDNGTGDWGNYTRTFPGGVYNIYMRGADGANTDEVDAASMDLVTGSDTTTNQTVLSLGTFSVPGFGWQIYADVPLIDADGNYAEFVGGGQQTLRVTTDTGNYNANYYFMVPAETTLPVNPPHLTAAASAPNIVVSFLSRTNTTYQLQFKANLTDANWTPVGASIPGNSLHESVTNSATAGSSGFYRLETLP